MTFTGWPVEAVEFFEGLAADNTRSYWQEHRPVYDRCVRAPMEELLAELADEFGPGRIFRPHRDVRFSRDKSPYKLSCDAHLAHGYLSLSAERLLAGSGLFMPDPDRLRRFRAAVDDDTAGGRLVVVVDDLRARGYEVTAHDVLRTAPRGYPKDHPRLELLRHKGLVMSRAWPVAAWLEGREPVERVVTCLRAAGPLNDWLEQHVG